MRDRITEALRESYLDILSSGVKTTLTAKDLTRLGIELAVPTFTPNQIAAIRENLGASQDVFARITGVSKVTVSQWERGIRTPSGAAAVLLSTIQHDPSAIHFRFDTKPASKPARPLRVPVDR
ncbi:MAG: helix-turn-helix domain-containing protein [Calditrichaeota bacterium]|nr:helix-turn-helix domain-containing protein [Calditrichota bacterium]